jgi:hypothetical protein
MKRQRFETLCLIRRSFVSYFALVSALVSLHVTPCNGSCSVQLSILVALVNLCAMAASRIMDTLTRRQPEGKPAKHPTSTSSCWHRTNRSNDYQSLQLSPCDYSTRHMTLFSTFSHRNP